MNDEHVAAEDIEEGGDSDSSGPFPYKVDFETKTQDPVINEEC